MSSLYVNGETGQVGIGTSEPSNLLHVEVNGNTSGNVEIMTRIENVEFPPMATSNVGFVADYGDMVASIDAGQVVLAPPREYPPAALSAGTTTLATTYGSGAYIASAVSIIATYDAYKAFNKTIAIATDAWAGAGVYNSLGTVYASAATTTTPTGTKAGDWLQIQLPLAIVLYNYKLTSANNSINNIPTRWIILGSNNGSTWDIVDATYENLSFVWSSLSQLVNFQVSSTTAYLYFRIVVLQINGAVNGQNAIIGEWSLHDKYTQASANLEFPPLAFSTYSLLVSAGPYYGSGVYNVSASSEVSSTYNTAKAFDKNLVSASKFVSASRYVLATGIYNGTVSTLVNNTPYFGEWLQFQAPQPIRIINYSIAADVLNRAPRTFYILGSLDNGLSWNTIDYQANITTWQSLTPITFTVSASKYYTTLRIVATRVGNLDSGMGAGDLLEIVEWRIYGDISSNYPKYKCALPASSTTVTNGSTYGAGTYSVYANTISNWTFSNQTTPAALVDKNTLVGWQSSSNIYTNIADAPALATPSIYFQLPDVITLTGYTLSARSATLTEVPTKWNLYGSNLSSVGAGWSTLDSRTAATTQVATPQSFTPLNVTAPYNLFRFDLLQNASATPAPISLAELKLTGSKPTSERRLVIASDGRVGINTSVAGLNNDAALTVAGDLAVTDIYVTGIIGDPILQTGPYVAFDGSAANRDKFLAWMQYVTSARYRYNFGPTVLKNSWWNVGTSVDLYDNYTYSTVAGKTGTANYWYYGGVTIPGNKVVFVPHNASTVLVFNAATNSFVEYATTLTTGANNYWGGALTYDNRVVFAPRSVASVGIFNPVTNTFSSVGIPAVGSTADRYYGAIATPDKRIIFVPASATTVGVFDPQTEIFTTYGSLPATTSKYSGGVLLPNNKIVFVPNTSTSIGIFDIATNTYSTITPVSPALPGANTFNGGVLMKNGHVLFIPTSVTYFGVFNPFSNTYYTISPANSPTIGYITGLLLSDGRVFLCPYSASTFGFFNPDDNTYTSLAGAPSGGAYIGANLLVDGRIILTQAQTTTIGILTPTQLTRSPPPELVYHPCFNKF